MFTTDSRTENFLTTIGVRFEYANGLLLPSSLANGWQELRPYIGTNIEQTAAPTARTDARGLRA